PVTPPDYISHSPVFVLFPYTTLFRSVFRFGISSGLNEASRSLGTSISSVPELVLTVFLPYPFLLLSENCQNQLRYTRYRCSKRPDRKSTRLNSSHVSSSYAVFCLQKN